MLTLEIPNRIFGQMLEQAKAEAPIEACGILAGSDGKVQKLYEMTNTRKSCTRFMMEPAEQFRVAKSIRSAGLKMLAIYHSHPEAPARVSAEDIRLALTPDVAHLILSLQDSSHPVVKGFLIDDGDVTEIQVRIMEQK